MLSSNTNTKTNYSATEMSDGGDMTTELPDSRGRENLAPPSNESLGIEAGACVKVIATSRRTRQNLFLYLLSSVFESHFHQYFSLMANHVMSRKNLVIRSCVAPGVPAQCGTFRFSQVSFEV